MSARPTQAHGTPLVGAFEADAWAGLVFVLGEARGLALRLAIHADGCDLPPRDLFGLAREIGPCAADGTYARVAFDLTLPLPPSPDTPPRSDAESERTLTWEWARLDAHHVAIRITALRHVDVSLECGAPWDWTCAWNATATGCEGWAGARGASAPPDITVTVVGPSDAARVLPLRLGIGRRPTLVLVSLRAEAASRAFPGMPVPHASESPTAADDDVVDRDEVSRAMDRAAARYAAERVTTSGALEGGAASIANNVHWMVLLQPESLRHYVPAGRRWIFPREGGGRDHWTIFAWDGFFNALLLSLESPPLAREMLAAVLATQYPSGNIPNWRGRFHGTPDRSQPPIGAFVVLKLALRLGDVDMARVALPALDRWHAWWQRRRRPSGLYAWGSTLPDIPEWVPAWERDTSHRQKAAWESGQDDLPNWDDAPWDEERSTLAMDCVDLSALLALDAECLSELHGMVGDAARAAAYRDEHAALCALIDDRLWDDVRGMYADRRDDGSLSPRLAASNALPLLAGAGDAIRVSRVLATLSDPARFWGEWIVPTVDRRDPAFADQQYWRGTIWPPTNFLIYEALHRVGADAAAATLAARSVALFVDDWRAHQVCRENFSSIDGRGGGQRHQSWGPLFAWIGVAELADVTPWDGLRLGVTAADAACGVSRLTLSGRQWDVAVGPASTRIVMNGVVVLDADAPLRLRHVNVTGSTWRAEIEAPCDTTIRLADGAVRVVRAGRDLLESTC